MRTLATLTAAVLFPLASASAQETRELGAHEHGHATLQLAIEGEAVEMKIELPGENVVGFEHAAETDEQRAKVEEAKTALADPLALFSLAGASGCTVSSAEVEVHQEGDHNAFEAEYELSCTDVSAVTGLETTLFELFPSLEEIDVEYVTPNGQGAGELEAGEPSLDLPTAT